MKLHHNPKMGKEFMSQSRVKQALVKLKSGLCGFFPVSYLSQSRVKQALVKLKQGGGLQNVPYYIYSRNPALSRP